MTRIIAVAAQKGGVGKTTTAINVACGIARTYGRNQVLLIDIDPQANATSVLTDPATAVGPERQGFYNIRHVLEQQTSLKEIIQTKILSPSQTARPIPTGSMHVAPSHLRLSMIETSLASTFRGEYRLREAVAEVANDYLYIIIDCPPSLGILTINALVCAQEILVPVEPGVFPLYGLGLLQSTINEVKKSNPALRITGVIPTKTDRTVASRETLEALKEEFGDLVLGEIPRRTAINEAHMQGMDIFSYDADGDGAKAYSRLVKKVLSREQK